MPSSSGLAVPIRQPVPHPEASATWDRNRMEPPSTSTSIAEPYGAVLSHLVAFERICLKLSDEVTPYLSNPEGDNFSGAGLPPSSRGTESLRDIPTEIQELRGELNKRLKVLTESASELLEGEELAIFNRGIREIDHCAGNYIARLSIVAESLADLQDDPEGRTKLAQLIESDLVQRGKLVEFGVQALGLCAVRPTRDVIFDAFHNAKRQYEKAHGPIVSISIQPDSPEALAMIPEHDTEAFLVLTELISNAVQATVNNGGQIVVRMSSESGQQEYRVTNPGFIPEEALDKIWKAGFSTKAKPSSSGPVGNQGLGLASAREAAESIGAKLSVSCEMAESGSLIHFDLVLPSRREQPRSSRTSPPLKELIAELDQTGEHRRRALEMGRMPQ